MLFELCTHNEAAILVRSWPAAAHWPGISVSVLRDSDEESQGWCYLFSHDWSLLLCWEAAAVAGSISHQRVLDCISWLLHPLARLFYAMCDRAHWNPQYLDEVRYLARIINERLLDGKVLKTCTSTHVI